MGFVILCLSGPVIIKLYLDISVYYSYTTTLFTFGHGRLHRLAATPLRQPTASSRDTRYALLCRYLPFISTIHAVITSPKCLTMWLSDTWNRIKTWPTSSTHPGSTCFERLWCIKRRVCVWLITHVVFGKERNPPRVYLWHGSEIGFRIRRQSRLIN